MHVLNIEWSSTMKYSLSLIIAAADQNTPSWVMAGHYFKHCYVLLQLLYATVNQ